MNDTGQDTSRVHILVVEDSPTQAEVLRRTLVKTGYAVTVARDGVEGLIMALKTPPNLVISDILMPNMDGIELCRRIKSEPKLRGTPVILLTSLTETGDVLRGLECGADNFITKPYEPEYLLSHCAAILTGTVTDQDNPQRQGIEILFAGRSYVITAGRRQILNTLLTTYETAVRKNEELLKAQEDLKNLNESLERKVRERTAALTEEIEERIWAEERIRQYAERMRALDEVSLALSQNVKDYRDALGLVAQRAAEMVGDWCVITLGSDASPGMNPVAFHHSDLSAAEWLREPFARNLYPGDHGLIGRVVATGAPALIEDLSREGMRDLINPELLPYLERACVRSLLSVPLLARGETIGTLGLFRASASPYLLEDQMFIQDLADRAAQTVYNARLYEEAQRRLNNLQALHAIDQAVSSSFNLNFILDIFLEQTLQQLQVDAASVLLIDHTTQTLIVAAGKGLTPEILQHAGLRVGEGHAGRVAMEQVLVTVQNLAEDQDFLHSRILFTEGFVTYFGVPLVVKSEVRGVLELYHRTRMQPDAEWLTLLTTLAGQAAIAIDNVTLFSDLQQSNLKLKVAYDTTLEGWSKALDMRDRETEGHAERVAEMTVRLARQFGMNEEELRQVRRGALLHDIGKMAIPDAILHKPGPLSDEEMAIMRRHPEYAHEFLWPIEYLRPALDIPWRHHEKWDGTGYPHGLQGEQIPLAARLFAVVDVWDALLSDRPYRAGWKIDRVIEHIRSLSGTHFDPRVVHQFSRIILA